jgi:hypothetical protein
VPKIMEPQPWPRGDACTGAERIEARRNRFDALIGIPSSVVNTPRSGCVRGSPHDLERDAAAEHERGRGVPKIVKAHPWETGPPKQWVASGNGAMCPSAASVRVLRPSEVGSAGVPPLVSSTPNFPERPHRLIPRPGAGFDGGWSIDATAARGCARRGGSALRFTA